MPCKLIFKTCFLTSHIMIIMYLLMVCSCVSLWMYNFLCCANGWYYLCCVDIFNCLSFYEKGTLLYAIVPSMYKSSESYKSMWEPKMKSIHSDRETCIGAAFCFALHFHVVYVIYWWITCTIWMSTVWTLLIMLFTLLHAFENDDTPITNMVRKRVAKRITFQIEHTTMTSGMRNPKIVQLPTKPTTRK